MKMPAVHTSCCRLLAVVVLALGVARVARGQTPPARLDTVEVRVESRAGDGPRTRGVQILSRSDLAVLPVRSLQEALRWAIGADLDARSAAQADLSLRGASFEQVVVMVDGVRMSDPQSGHFDLDLGIPLERVERVEVLRGPASSLFGPDAVGGVVNIVTRGPERRGGELRVEGGSNASRRFGAAGATSLGEGPLAGAHFAAGADWWRGDGHRPGTDFNVRQVSAAAALPVRAGTLNADASWGLRDFGADGFYSPFASFEKTRTQALSLGWSGQVGRFAVRPRAWRRVHDDDFILKRNDPSYYENIHQSRQSGGEVVFSARVAGNGTLVAGGELVSEAIASQRLGHRTERRLGAFAEGSASRGPGALRVGVRADDHEAFGTFVSPSMSGTLAIARRVRLRASFGRAFRTPTWTERYYTDPSNRGRADLRPETSWTGETGVDLRLGHGTTLAVAGFRRQSDGLIDWARPRATGGVWETRNVNRATFDGVEVELGGVHLGPAAFTSGATFIRVHSDADPAFESKYALRALTRSVLLRGQWPLGTRAFVSAGVRNAQRSGERAYTVADVRVARSVWCGQLFLDLTNAFDARYDDITRLPAPRRGVMAGVVVR